MLKNIDLSRLLLLIPAVFAVFLTGEVLSTWAGRAAYPYDLEWMEGGMLAHAWRLLHGEGVYVEPGPDFISMVYPPLYPALVALLGGIFGLTPMIGRLVSVAGTLAAASAAGFLVARNGGDRWIGAFAAVIFLGCYTDSGAFYDLVRPDAMAMGLLGWSLALGLEESRRARDISAFLLFLAFTTKHNAAAYGFPVALALWARLGWREALRWGLIAAVPGLLFVLVMQGVTGGNFLTYLLAVSGSHPIVAERVFPGTERELSQPLLATTVVVLLWLVSRAPGLAPRFPMWATVSVPLLLAPSLGALDLIAPKVKGIPPGMPVDGVASLALAAGGGAVALIVLAHAAVHRSISWRFIYGVGTGLVAVTTVAVMRGHHGGFLNVFMPAHWVLACAGGLAVGDMLREMPRWPGAVFAAIYLSGQLAWMDYRVQGKSLVPSAEDVEMGDEIVAALKEVDGEVLSPFASFLPVYAGKKPSLHLIALWDIKHPEGPWKVRADTISAAMREKRWGAVLDAGESMGFGAQKFYKLSTDFGEDKAMMPKTGWRRRPSKLLVPK